MEDVEVALEVGIAVGVVLPDLLSGTPDGGLLIEAIGQAVAGSLPTGSVAAPAAAGHPLMAASGSVGVDGYQADIALAQLPAPGVHALGARPE